MRFICAFAGTLFLSLTATTGSALAQANAEQAEVSTEATVDTTLPPSNTATDPSVETTVAADDEVYGDVLVESTYAEMSLSELVNVRVVTASLLEESVRDSPVPVTVITPDMIQASGAQTLQEALVIFVPGMTNVADHNEMNVAMRGIYASSQQKILVMVDGHRINSRAYSMGDVDHSIGIGVSKVKQIEVLRGPGSSLYGNVALTAVVNVITRDGADLDGATVEVGGGDYWGSGDASPVRSSGQPLAAGRTANFTFGESFGQDHDVLAWGSFFFAHGQEVAISPANDYSDVPQGGSAVVGGVRDPGAYDVGAKYQLGQLTLFGNVRRGKLIEPFSGGGITGEAYDYDDYRTFQGHGPGLTSSSRHLELMWNRSLASFVNVESRAYVDQNDLTTLIVTDPAMRSYGLVSWNDYAYGGIAQATISYPAAALGSGNFTAGAQVDRMTLYDSIFLVGTDGEWTAAADNDASPLLERGSETVYSAFGQVKHRFSDQVLLNLGARVDAKDRLRGELLLDFSPRLAAVWTPSDEVDVKLSYAESFVDAPYWYRYNSLASYQGSESLTPEHLRSVQATPTLRLAGGLFQASSTFFYNHVFDFVFRNLDAQAGEPNYENAGSLKSLGVESEIAYLRAHYRARANATYQRAIDAQDFGADESSGRINNVPSFVANLILSGQPLPTIYDNLTLGLVTRYVGPQLAPIGPTFRMSPDGTVMPFSDQNYELDDYWLITATIDIRDVITPGLGARLTVNNVLDHRYEQGGSVVFPYPQPGRSIFAYARYSFAP